MQNKNGLLMVANWGSNVGYAWWLMESFWAAIANEFTEYQCRIAYPSVSTVPDAITQAPIIINKVDFTRFDIRSIIEQCAYLRRHRIKTIYFTDQATRHWRYAAFRLCGVRSIIVHDHTPGLRTAPSGIKRIIKSILARLPFVTVDAAIGATEFVRERIITVGCLPESKCFAAPNGIPEKACEKADLRELFGIPEGRKVIVSVGRASKYKGIHRALSWLSQVNGDWHYLLCGDGPDLNEFKQLAKYLGISDRVTFAGNRSDVPSILRSCYAAIHPSDGEVGYSLSILEFMQAGLPVIVPNNPSVCGATSVADGLVYPTGDRAISALNYLLANEIEAKYMGSRAKQRAKDSFSLDGTHEALIHIMRRFCSA